ncbi:TPA: GNAT family N-acetyltransferase [Streptococcus suis]|nr:GNAT family N-acetyltransferase [Streptococcus suis]HEM6117495.1 GNAT family N-acetyltransferase [Streptococcus suis]
MKITITYRLTKTEENQVRQLIASIRKHDHLTREPFLINILNVDQDMPAFFLAYDLDELRGFLTVYADTLDEPELMIWVAPTYRHQGIAKRLFRSYQEATEPYHLGKPSFSIERHFLRANSDLANAWHLKETDDSELWMTRGRQLIELPDKKELRILLADDKQIEAIAMFQSHIFDEPIEVTRTYAKEAIGDSNSLLYVVLIENFVVASCTVDLSSGDQVLYGLAVKKDYQNQGIGRYLTSFIINDRIAKDHKSFQIAVESDNLIAKNLYEKLGFVSQSEVTYLV